MSALRSPRRKRRIGRGDPHAMQPSTPRPHRRDCQGRLVAALEAACGEGARVIDASMRPWCSATFVGAQHRIRLRIERPDAAQHGAALATGLPDATFNLPAHIVADICVDAVESADDGAALLQIAVLTIEDW